jgi:hypothetical protein
MTSRVAAAACAACALLAAAPARAAASLPPRDGGCARGSSIPDPSPFWVPDTSPGDADAKVGHVPVPYTTKPSGFTVDAGSLGVNRYADVSMQANIDGLGRPYAHGLVDVNTGLPTSTTGGWGAATQDLHEDWSEGLSPDRFNVLLQKESRPWNIELIGNVSVPEVGALKDLRNPRIQNILRLSGHIVAPSESENDGSDDNGNDAAADDDDGGADVVGGGAGGGGAAAAAALGSGRGGPRSRSRRGDSAAFFNGTGAILQTTPLFSSGFFEVKARIPAVKGFVFALWTYHYETHLQPGDPNLHGKIDNQ